MTDLHTIRRFVSTCHVFNANDPGTRANIRSLIMPVLRRYRREMVSTLAFVRRSSIKLSYADILDQNRQIRHALAAAELRMKCATVQANPIGYDVDGDFDEFGAFATI